MDLVKIVEKRLRRREPLSVGCVRRNMWQKTPSYRATRGNAILSVLDTYMVPFKGLLGDFDMTFLDHGHNDTVLFFRAGPWKDYWAQDIYDAQALIQNDHGHSPANLTVLWENNGVLAEVTLPELSDPELAERYMRLYKRVGTYALDGGIPPRIAKDGPRKGMCHFCPVKAKCDAIDIQEGATDDWPGDYQRGPVIR